MFSIGQTYKITMWEDDGTTEYFNCTVVEVDMPLVKFDHLGTEWVINVSSKAFVSATPQAP